MIFRGEKQTVDRQTKTFQQYLLTSKATWFWIVNLIVSITVFLFLIPLSLFSIIQQILGLIFLFFLPGYTLLKIIIPKQDLSDLSHFALSIGISMGLVPLLTMPLFFLLKKPPSTLLTLFLAVFTSTFSAIAIKLEHRRYIEASVLETSNKNQE